MNIALWMAQPILAFAFIMAGGLKAFAYEKSRKMSERYPGEPGLSRGLTTFIGVSEMAGALGVIVLMATGIMPQLTPIAAAALALVMLLALGHHVQHHDPFAKLRPPLVLLALSVFVAYGRGISLFHGGF